MFLREYNAEYHRLAPLFAAADQADKEFHAAWKEGVSQSGAYRYKQTERYQETLDQFHESRRVIDQIVMTALGEAKAGNIANLPTLFAYIALPGRYHRSGYQRADIWRFLKRCNLDDKQVLVLRGIVLQRIEDAGPEFVEIARTARKYGSVELRESVRRLLLDRRKAHVIARARRLLSLLEECQAK